ncbi:MAG: YjjG family noncanonical pyrimidine nucleotidase [Clostridia bacterium]|nr:YjjG family noncanonical pyrimidine nucleotidase [Clostridia bacterium]MBR0349913.1 YjjG family noncanonical pyrimidine nucleotidase [Clostridia bacterium]
MKYTTLLFDLDDTLMDFKKAEENAIEKLLLKYSLPATEENKRLYSLTNQSKWKALEKGEITRKELFATRFPDFFKALGVEADGAKANADYMHFLSQGRFVIDGAEDICRELRKSYSMYIITNGAKIVQQGRLTDLPLMQYFDGVFISEEVGFDKPKKEYFDHVFLNIPEKDKSKCLVIGDSLSSDILGAVNYGIDCCWISEKTSSEIKPTYQISTLKELLDILIA